MNLQKLFISALLSALPCAAAITPVPCLATAPLSGLIALGSSGCTIGDKLFTNFSLGTTGTLGTIDASAINVLLSTSPQGNEVLNFFTGLTAVGGANGGQLISTIGYDVSTVTGAALIEDLTLNVGSLQNVGTGPNSASVTEYACVGLNITCTAQNARFLLNAVPNGTDHLTFTPTSSLSVAKQLTLNAAALNTVTLNSMTNEVSQLKLPASGVPEPATASLLGGGLLGLALACRKLRKS